MSRFRGEYTTSAELTVPNRRSLRIPRTIDSEPVRKYRTVGPVCCGVGGKLNDARGARRRRDFGRRRAHRREVRCFSCF